MLHSLTYTCRSGWGREGETAIWSSVLQTEVKVVKHIEMHKAAPKKSICHFQKLEMILKWNKQNTVRLPQKYQFLLIKHKINC